MLILNRTQHSVLLFSAAFIITMGSSCFRAVAVSPKATILPPPKESLINSDSAMHTSENLPVSRNTLASAQPVNSQHNSCIVKAPKKLPSITESPIELRLPNRTIFVQVQDPFAQAEYSPSASEVYKALATAQRQQEIALIASRPANRLDLNTLKEEVPRAITALYVEKGFLTRKAELNGDIAVEGEKVFVRIKISGAPLPIRIKDRTDVFLALSIEGRTVFDKEKIQGVLKDLVIVDGPSPKKIDKVNATRVIEAINTLHGINGYLTSTAFEVDDLPSKDQPTAFPPSQKVLPMRIRINEGWLKSIEIEGAERLANYVCDRLQFGLLRPLNTETIEDRLRFLREDPLFRSVEATMTASNSPHLSDLKVKVVEARTFSGSVNLDNFSPPSVGSMRTGFDLRLRSLAIPADEITYSYNRSITGGSNVLGMSYQLPIRATNGTLQLRTVPTRNEVTQREFKALGIRGESELYEVLYRQPILRAPDRFVPPTRKRQESNFFLGFTHQSGQTFVFDELPRPFGIGPDEDGVSRTSVFKIGQEYLSRSTDEALLLRHQVNLGTGLFGATSNQDPIPDGRFVSWLGQAQWLRKFSRVSTLILQGEMQLTPNSLLPSQQFVIGGGQSLRGYRQNARSGDNGFRLSIEHQILLSNNRQTDVTGKSGELVATNVLSPPPASANGAVSEQPVSKKQPTDRPTASIERENANRASEQQAATNKPIIQSVSGSGDLVKLALFLDAGMIWDARNNPNFSPPQQFLAGVGAGLIIEPKSRDGSYPATIRVDAALPIVSSETKGNDLQDFGLYFSIRYRF